MGANRTVPDFSQVNAESRNLWPPLTAMAWQSAGEPLTSMRHATRTRPALCWLWTDSGKAGSPPAIGWPEKPRVWRKAAGTPGNMTSLACWVARPGTVTAGGTDPNSAYAISCRVASLSGGSISSAVLVEFRDDSEATGAAVACPLKNAARYTKRHSAALASPPPIPSQSVRLDAERCASEGSSVSGLKHSGQTRGRPCSMCRTRPSIAKEQ